MSMAEEVIPSTPKPHPIVLPNLIRLILTFANNRTLLNALRVSQMFFHIAGPVLYRSLEVRYFHWIPFKKGLDEESYFKWKKRKSGWTYSKWELLQHVRSITWSASLAQRHIWDLEPMAHVMFPYRGISPNHTIKIDCCEWDSHIFGGSETDLICKSIAAHTRSSHRIVLEYAREEDNVYPPLSRLTSAIARPGIESMTINLHLGRHCQLQDDYSHLSLLTNGCPTLRIILVDFLCMEPVGEGNVSTMDMVAEILWNWIKFHPGHCKVYLLEAPEDREADRPVIALRNLFNSRYNHGKDEDVRDITILGRREYLQEAQPDELREDDIEFFRNAQAKKIPELARILIRTSTMLMSETPLFRLGSRRAGGGTRCATRDMMSGRALAMMIGVPHTLCEGNIKSYA